MQRRRRPLSIWLVLLVVLALFLSQGRPQVAQLWALESEEDIAALEQLSRAFVDIAEKVKPAVVYIETERKVEGVGPPEMEEFFKDWPFRWRFEFPERRREYRQQVVGSGVIVQVHGDTAYILTNDHVVKDADKIKVIVGVRETEKEEYEGKVRGRDPKTELALVEIKGDGSFQAAELGDSGRLKVGEWVLTIGNPFGYRLSHTVSAGIVSAKGRRVGIVREDFAYEDLIQTDAAINPGNSGGPLINLKGEVVGINLAIATRTGTYAGVGFAVPINTAKEILSGLIKGRIVRGYLGISLQALTPELKEKFNVEHGVLVAQVLKDTPADGVLVKGDVITNYGGRPILDSEEFRHWVARTKVGEKVKIKVMRNGKEKALEVLIAEQPEEMPVVLLSGKTSEFLGITVQELTPELGREMGYRGEEGVLVSSVEEDSPASDQIRPGDLIKEVNQEPLRSIAEFERETNKAKPEASVLFYIRRGHNYYFALVPGRQR